MWCILLPLHSLDKKVFKTCWNTSRNIKQKTLFKMLIQNISHSRNGKNCMILWVYTTSRLSWSGRGLPQRQGHHAPRSGSRLRRVRPGYRWLGKRRRGWLSCPGVRGEEERWGHIRAMCWHWVRAQHKRPVTRRQGDERPLQMWCLRSKTHTVTLSVASVSAQLYVLMSSDWEWDTGIVRL